MYHKLRRLNDGMIEDISIERISAAIDVCCLVLKWKHDKKEQNLDI